MLMADRSCLAWDMFGHVTTAVHLSFTIPVISTMSLFIQNPETVVRYLAAMSASTTISSRMSIFGNGIFLAVFEDKHFLVLSSFRLAIIATQVKGTADSYLNIHTYTDKRIILCWGSFKVSKSSNSQHRQQVQIIQSHLPQKYFPNSTSETQHN